MLAVLLVVLAVPGLHAQVPDTLALRPVPAPRFEAARALAADPLGSLYVADAGGDLLWHLDAATGLARRLGGPGRADGAFDDPRDVDPTNGLVLVVADAGNNRIQRLSRDYRHLESLPVRRVEGPANEWASQPTYRPDDPALAALVDGRPVAVAVSGADETFVVDAAHGVVVKYDPRRRPVRVVGGFGEAHGQLASPVALALTDRRLYVADAGRAEVLVYDLFGGFDRALGSGRLDGLRAVAVADGLLWAVLPDRLVAFSLDGRLDRVVVPSPAGLSLRDVASLDGRLYVLTDRGLWTLP